MLAGVIEMDAADRLILDEAAMFAPGRTIVVIGSEALAAEVPGARSYSDTAGVGVSIRRDGAYSTGDAGDAGDATDAAGRVDASASYRDLLAGASLVLLRLPKSLDALDRMARLIAIHATPDVVVVAGGRLKYMTAGMNEVLRRSFGQLDVSLARQKSRVLIAREPLEVEPLGPKRVFHAELDLWVGAAPGVFAGTSLDIGTRALVDVLEQVPEYETAIDLGCGTGILAALLKRRNPNARVVATDASAIAAESARETMAANDLDVEVRQDAGLGSWADNSADLIVLNPPFHDEGAITKDIALDLFADASRVLKPGGELWSVWNSHLGYRAPLERIVGATRQISRTTKFTVTTSTKTSAKLGRADSRQP